MRYKFRTGWLVSVTTPAGAGRSAVRELYHAAIPCAVAAVRAVTTVSRARLTHSSKRRKCWPPGKSWAWN